MLAPAALPRHGEHRQPADERHVDDATSCASSPTRFGWGLDDFEWLTINAMKSAFAPFDERLRIINGIIKPRYALLKAERVGISSAPRRTCRSGGGAGAEAPPEPRRRHDPAPPVGRPTSPPSKLCCERDGRSARMAAVDEVPMRLAPASIMASAFSAERMPPLALTPRSGPTVARINRTASTVGAAGGGVEPGRRLDEVGAGGDRGLAGGDDLVVA